MPPECRNAIAFALIASSWVVPLALGQSTAPSPAGPAPEQQPVEDPPPLPTSPSPAAPPITPGRPITYSLAVRGELGTSAELSDSPGDVAVSRIGAALAVGFPIGERGQLNLGFDYELSSYDFQNASGLIAGTDSPFEDVQRYALSVRYAQQLSRRWALVAGGSVGLAGEEGAEASESLFTTGYLGARYALSESVQAGFGAAFGTQLEDDTLLLPLLLLDWQINEQWLLSNQGKLGLTLSYTPVESWTFSVGAEYQFRDFRLDRDGPVPGGVGHEVRVPLTVSASFRPTPQLSVDAGVGVGLYRTFEIRDSGGRELADFDADPAPFLTLQFGYRF
jgi:hypothetical protein